MGWECVSECLRAATNLAAFDLHVHDTPYLNH
jgi:hypothetical protein